MNPGPVYRYPCTICAKPVKVNQRGIGCDRCDRWTHAACCGVSDSEYEQLDAQGESSLWFCPSCINKELPFANVSLCTESESDYAGDTSASQFALFNPAGPEDSLGRESVFRDRRGHLLVCYLNVRSVLPKSDELHLLLERQDGVVLGLSETWLDESVMDSEVEIPGFKHFRRDRNRRGGGVMVYVPEQFKVVRRKELEDNAVEALWIEARMVNTVVLVCNVYCPPNAVLVSTIDDWRQALDEDKLVGSIMVDLSKAFDIVSHSILLRKLESYGIRGGELGWFANFLNERRQRVCINGVQSGWTGILRGIPQGSILGPLLFTIYVNDLPQSVVHGRIKQYTDNTTLYAVSDNHVDLSNSLSMDLAGVTEWVERNGLKLNEAKTQMILLSRKKRSKELENVVVKLKGQEVARSRKVKYLEVWVDECLTWTDHVEAV